VADSADGIRYAEAAQARAENLTLPTADDLVTAYGDFVRLVRWAG
jgi:hypothetical protein